MIKQYEECPCGERYPGHPNWDNAIRSWVDGYFIEAVFEREEFEAGTDTLILDKRVTHVIATCGCMPCSSGVDHLVSGFYSLNEALDVLERDRQVNKEEDVAHWMLRLGKGE